jgi:hypothetical protein
LRATWATAYPSSCAWKPGSSAETPAGCSIASSRSASTACAACSASGERCGSSSSSALRSSTSAAASPRTPLMAMSLSHFSSSTSRITARAAVLSPVGRYGVA